jgi:hypothetical protein
LAASFGLAARFFTTSWQAQLMVSLPSGELLRTCGCEPHEHTTQSLCAPTRREDLGRRAVSTPPGGRSNCSGLTLYGLRHTVAVIMREQGFDERTIADALGQKTIEMARHYAKGADLKPRMRGVVKSLDEAWNERKTKTVKPGK